MIQQAGYSIDEEYIGRRIHGLGRLLLLDKHLPYVWYNFSGEKKTDKSLINAGHMPQKCLHTSKAEIPNTQTPRYQNATKCFFKQCIAAEGWRGERYYTPLPDFLQYLRS